jgi:hypothetical protein
MASGRSHAPAGRVLARALFWAAAGLVLAPVGLGLVILGLIMLGTLLLGMLAASGGRRALRRLAGAARKPPLSGDDVPALLDAVESGRLSVAAALRRLSRPHRVRRSLIMLVTFRLSRGARSSGVSLPFTPLAIIAVGLEFCLYPILYVAVGALSLCRGQADLRDLLAIVPALPVSRVLSYMLVWRRRFEIAVNGPRVGFRFAVE